MKVEFFASQPHYGQHLAPIFWALRPEMRGRFYVSGALAEMAGGEGIPGWTIGNPPPTGLPILVAGYVDELACGNRPILYLEHGSGQSYPGSAESARDPSYSGGDGHDQVVLFLCPSERVAGKWRMRYPNTPAVAVGSPRLDAWHRRAPGIRAKSSKPVVAFTWHSDARTGCPESRWALPHYEAALSGVIARLRARGWVVLGHGHPRAWRRLSTLWRALGAEVVQNADEVFARADVLVADNTSLIPEFASIGKPVVFLNCPTYRRNVIHGQRFWTWIGDQISVDDPVDLMAGIQAAYEDSSARRESRRLMVADAYVATDGRAAERSVQAIQSLLTRTEGLSVMR